MMQSKEALLEKMIELDLPVHPNRRLEDTARHHEVWVDAQGRDITPWLAETVKGVYQPFSSPEEVIRHFDNLVEVNLVEVIEQALQPSPSTFTYYTGYSDGGMSSVHCGVKPALVDAPLNYTMHKHLEEQLSEEALWRQAREDAHRVTQEGIDSGRYMVKALTLDHGYYNVKMETEGEGGKDK